MSERKQKQKLFKPITNKFMLQRPYVTKQEDNIIKLTAQFAAKNGKEFLTMLYNQKQRDSQFGFLNKGHPQYAYFEALTKMYGHIIHPNQNYIRFLSNTFGDPRKLLVYCQAKSEYLTREEQNEEKKQSRKEFIEGIERTIDWNDFVVVHTVDF